MDISLWMCAGLGFAAFCVALVIYAFIVVVPPPSFPYPLVLLTVGLLYALGALAFVMRLPYELYLLLYRWYLSWPSVQRKLLERKKAELEARMHWIARGAQAEIRFAAEDWARKHETTHPKG